MSVPLNLQPFQLEVRTLQQHRMQPPALDRGSLRLNGDDMTHPSVFATLAQRYFAEYEFSTDTLLCCSDVESLTMQEVLEAADDECKQRCVPSLSQPAVLSRSRVAPVPHFYS